MKKCSVCDKEFPKMWKAKTKDHGQMCKFCWGPYKAPESEDHGKVVSKVATQKKRSVIAPISEKKAKELVVYRKVRDAYFKEHPICEFPGCSSDKITLHHMAGRIGSLLTDRRYFKSLCIKHHRWAEENPKEAKELGLSITRIGNKQ